MDELSRDDLRELLLDAAPTDATREAMFAHTFSDQTAGAGADLLPTEAWFEADPYGYDDPDETGADGVDTAGAGDDVDTADGWPDDASYDTPWDDSHEQSATDVTDHADHADVTDHGHHDDGGVFDGGHGGW